MALRDVSTLRGELEETRLTAAHSRRLQEESVQSHHKELDRIREEADELRNVHVSWCSRCCNHLF